MSTYRTQGKGSLNFLCSTRYRTCSQKHGLNFLSANAVTARLKSPASSVFNENFDVKTNGAGDKLISSYVDSQNTFGAMLRTEFHCVVNRETDEVIYLLYGSLDQPDLAVVAPRRFQAVDLNDENGKQLLDDMRKSFRR